MHRQEKEFYSWECVCFPFYIFMYVCIFLCKIFMIHKWLHNQNKIIDHKNRHCGYHECYYIWQNTDVILLKRIIYTKKREREREKQYSKRKMRSSSKNTPFCMMLWNNPSCNNNRSVKSCGQGEKCLLTREQKKMQTGLITIDDDSLKKESICMWQKITSLSNNCCAAENVRNANILFAY